LRAGLAFYIGGLNLHEQIERKGEPTSFRMAAAPGRLALAARGLCDVCLALTLEPELWAMTSMQTGRTWC
jgi:hypothetical protein